MIIRFSLSACVFKLGSAVLNVCFKTRYVSTYTQLKTFEISRMITSYTIVQWGILLGRRTRAL